MTAILKTVGLIHPLVNLKKDRLLFPGQSTCGVTKTTSCKFSGGSGLLCTGLVQGPRLKILLQSFKWGFPVAQRVKNPPAIRKT